MGRKGTYKLRKASALLCLALLLAVNTLNLTACADSPNKVVPFLALASSQVATSIHISIAPSPDKAVPSEDWQARWLKSIPCRPPCWEGVTPGTTTLKDALTTLQTSPLVNGVSAYNYYRTGLLEWQGFEPGAGGQGSFYFDMPDHKIESLRPFYPKPIKLGLVIANYGEPDYVMTQIDKVIEGSGISYRVKIIYSKLSFTLTETSTTKQNISAETLFEKIDFYDPKINLAQEALDTVVEAWHGFNNFDFYHSRGDRNPSN